MRAWKRLVKRTRKWNKLEDRPQEELGGSHRSLRIFVCSWTWKLHEIPVICVLSKSKGLRRGLGCLEKDIALGTESQMDKENLTLAGMLKWPNQMPAWESWVTNQLCAVLIRMETDWVWFGVPRWLLWTKLECWQRTFMCWQVCGIWGTYMYLGDW